MKNRFASFVQAMLLFLLPMSLMLVSCKNEDEDKQHTWVI